MIPEELRKQIIDTFERAKENREDYFNWIKTKIDEAIELINSFDKLYIIGGLGLRLLKSSPSFYSVSMEEIRRSGREIPEDELLVEDEHIETIFEYALNIASTSANSNSGNIPTQDDIQKIYDLLLEIKTNIGFYEMTADIPKDGNEFDHLLRTEMMTETLNVRGVGYSIHVRELFLELFSPHDQILIDNYGFTAEEFFDAVRRLNLLVTSKIGNALGGGQSHTRLMEWMEKKGEKEVEEEMIRTGKPFITQFVEENPDLHDPEEPFKVILHSLDNISSSEKIFWVIPTNDIEKKVYELISHKFGDNSCFLNPEKFKAFPLGDSIIFNKPLVEIGGKFFCFSLLLTYRNIFSILSSLIEDADANYYKNEFLGNASNNSKDNYIEDKAKKTFEKLIPEANFYSNLKYDFDDDGELKATELDILGESDKAIYIIEVKAGELNKKHRRGALKGLKDRLSETINAGSYQCERAKKFIESNDNPEFTYAADGGSHVIEIDKNKGRKIFKITVTFEHLGFISANLKMLVNNGVLKPDYKWSWIVSLYDLMIFADLIDGEDQFIEYLTHRLELYDRDDVRFFDEIDLLEYFLENDFPIPNQEENKVLLIDSGSEKIDEYFEKKGLGFPMNPKPTKAIAKPTIEKKKAEPPMIKKSKIKKKKKNRNKASRKSKRVNRKRKK